MMRFLRRLRCLFGLHAWSPDSWFDNKEGWCRKCRWCGKVGAGGVPAGR